MLIHSRSIAVIHAQGLVPALIGNVLKIIWRKRLIVSIHAVYGWLYNLSQTLFGKIARRVLSGADVVLTLAERSRTEIISLGVPASKVVVFTYWIDLGTFQLRNQKECRVQLGWHDEFVVLFVGRLIPVKGVETLIEVAKRLPQLLFVFVGDGPLRESLIGITGFQKNVMFLGKVANAELPIYYNAADILCIPSQYEEGFGRVILEALACGCPVLGAHRGGIPEAVDDSVSVLVEPNAAQLANALRLLLDYPGALEQLRKNCRPYAERHFGPGNAQIIERAYAIVRYN
jgi:glycosyltransferase involved in cell wall biosynthesis